MGLRPARSPSGKSSTQPPEALTLSFLTEASKGLAIEAPRLAAQLGRRALKLVHSRPALKMPATARLCQTCGKQRGQAELLRDTAGGDGLRKCRSTHLVLPETGRCSDAALQFGTLALCAELLLTMYMPAWKQQHRFTNV